ncbi:hypothetical protein OAP87_03695 [Flavobacteriaceae bacterium]|nr:hypothetical protein [Flavobacteriaceae bacterium]
MEKFNFKHFPELISRKILQSIAETTKFIAELNNRFDNNRIFKIKK